MAGSAPAVFYVEALVRDVHQELGVIPVGCGRGSFVCKRTRLDPSDLMPHAIGVVL